jgi:hypothetical protein
MSRTKFLVHAIVAALLGSGALLAQQAPGRGQQGPRLVSALRVKRAQRPGLKRHFSSSEARASVNGSTRFVEPVGETAEEIVA